MKSPRHGDPVCSERLPGSPPASLPSVHLPSTLPVIFPIPIAVASAHDVEPAAEGVLFLGLADAFGLVEWAGSDAAVLGAEAGGGVFAEEDFADDLGAAGGGEAAGG